MNTVCRLLSSTMLWLCAPSAFSQTDSMFLGKWQRSIYQVSYASRETPSRGLEVLETEGRIGMLVALYKGRFEGFELAAGGFCAGLVAGDRWGDLTCSAENKSQALLEVTSEFPTVAGSGSCISTLRLRRSSPSSASQLVGPFQIRCERPDGYVALMRGTATYDRVSP